MTDPHVGFYVHYHGLGHKHRTEAILEHLRLPATVVTSRLQTLPWRGAMLREVIGIACDIDAVPENGLKRAEDSPALHYAPLWAPTCTERVAEYSGWLHRTRPALMVVDVSCEISMLTRLAGIPQIVVRQHGDRSDSAHLHAYAAAESLLAPFPRSMEDEITPQWVQEKTVYLDGFCRNTGPSMARSEAREFLELDEHERVVVVLFGRGGASDREAALIAAARRLSEWRWIAVGIDGSGGDLPSNLRLAGWVDDPQPYLRAADVVVTAAGHNSVMEAGSAGCRFVAIAEPRPFDEQLRKARVLQRERLAVGLDDWPDPARWPEIIRQAENLEPGRWAEIFESDGALQAARHIEQQACVSHAVSRQIAYNARRQHDMREEQRSSTQAAYS